VASPAWRAAEPRARRLARSAAAATLRHERRAGSLTILLSDDDRVAELNLAFRGKSGPTNVLSFPMAGPGTESLGDIALAFATCRREAAAQGKPLADHLRHLTAHGVLHLLGYDHQSDAEADAMEAKERAILAGLGVPDPYGPAALQEDHGRN